MGRKSFKPGTLHAPLPAVMATVGTMENANIITVAWTGILSSDPARTYISVRPSRYSHKLLSENGEFVINLTTEALARATDYAGIYTGAKVDKFEKLGLTKVPSEAVATPTIAESPLALECRVFEVLHFGTHDVFMADIVSVSCDEGILDEKGKICLERAGLMAYAHGEYFALGKSLGRFGFSAAKPNKTNAKAEKNAISKPGDKRAETVKVAQVKKAKTPHGKVDRKDVGKPENHKKRVTGANKTKGNGAK
jgi:flavin reductase (DIM6/NTAB) family NADH-FMN oxidoreductase RutF